MKGFFRFTGKILFSVLILNSFFIDLYADEEEKYVDVIIEDNASQETKEFLRTILDNSYYDEFERLHYIVKVLNESELSGISGVNIFSVTPSSIFNLVNFSTILPSQYSWNYGQVVNQKYGGWKFTPTSQGIFSRMYALEPSSLVTVENLSEGIPGYNENDGDLPILAMKITGNTAGVKPAVLFLGGHHGNELMSVEVAIHLGEFLVAEYSTNQRIKDIVDKSEIWIIPLVNPNGYPTTRENHNNINLNRNYSSVSLACESRTHYGIDFWSNISLEELFEGNIPPENSSKNLNCIFGSYSDGKEGTEFSEYETRSVRDFVNDHLNSLQGMISYHTQGGLVLYGYGNYAVLR